jgi:hypothetical protein
MDRDIISRKLEIPVVFHTADEIARRMGYCLEEICQLHSIAAEDCENWGPELDALAIPLANSDSTRIT